jgi:hydroxymethylbilane synthase
VARPVRVKMLSRASSLARLQTALVERALRHAHPGLAIECVTRASAGDQDQTSPLWKLPDKGAFTADLSQALVAGDADIVVHSFKDLPIEMPAGTRIAGALPRADARDALLIKRTAIALRPESLRILSSSPRRGWLLGDALPPLLPWPVRSVEAVPVRGNIETRIRKLIEGDAHGLVVAKAALDRLLGFGAPFDREAAVIRTYLADCRWMVMPMREFPWAPAQGAIAIETAATRDDLAALIAPIVCGVTVGAVQVERAVLASHGGGCHQALGAAVVEKPYGRVVSVRARETAAEIWELQRIGPEFPKAAAERLWPPPGFDVDTERRTLTAAQPDADGVWVSRAEALPASWQLRDGTITWAAGSQTWRRLAARGIWVNGCADGLGDDERPAVDVLAGRPVNWVRLTHDRAPIAEALATYRVDVTLPDDLPARSHFFWNSGDVFKRALDRWPGIRAGWHASGPGRTRTTILAELGDSARVGVWLDRSSWERDVCL